MVIQSHSMLRGTSLYYALLFTEANLKKPIEAIACFAHEMKNIVEKIQEPQVAKVKLSWWTQEIANLYNGKPHHPLSKSLAGWVAEFNLPQIWFQRLINTKLKLLENPHFDTHAELIQFCQLRASKIVLFSKILSSTDKSNAENRLMDDFAVSISTCIQLVQLIRYFGKDCANGKIYFPHHDLQQFTITEHQLFKRQCPPQQLKSFLALQGEYAKKAYQHALAILPSSEYLNQLPLIILAKINLALLREIEKENFSVLHHKYSLTPLRKFWIAWTTYLSKKLNQNKKNLPASVTK